MLTSRCCNRKVIELTLRRSYASSGSAASATSGGKKKSFSASKNVSFKDMPKVAKIQPKPASPLEKDITPEQKIENLKSHQLAEIQQQHDFYYTPSFQQLGMLGNIHDLNEDWDNVTGIPLSSKDHYGVSEAHKLFNKKDHEEANIQFSRHGGDSIPYPRLPSNNPPLISAQTRYGGTFSRALLNDRKTLNSLSDTTLRLIDEYLKEVIINERISCFSLHTSTPGLIQSAGTDFVAMFEKRNTEYPQEYLKKLYKAMYLLAITPKPQINILDGLAVGSGAALTANSGIRVVTENAVMSFPEAALGYFPDCGSMRLLARMDGFLGKYLALTGRRLRAGELIQTGVGNFYMRTAHIPLIEDSLCQLPPNRPDRMFLHLDTHSDSFDDLVSQPTHYTTYREAIDRCFSKDTVEEIIEALHKERQHSDWAKRCIQNMNKSSPLGLKLTNALYRHVAEAKETISLRDLLSLEYKIANCLFEEGSDLWEGVRSNLVYGRAPNYRYKTLSDVTDSVIEDHFNFAPKGGEFVLRNMPNNSERFEEMVHEFYDNYYTEFTEQDSAMFRTTSGDPITDKHVQFIEEFYNRVPPQEYVQMQQIDEVLNIMSPEDLYRAY
ncbi:hypothetical protein DFA_11299 [Cavenderia fasciculata]|uniref:Enoyl-CoA hydratase/isomerase domain-containing protein n=1 Tax=Cavenderia fasciculata TaxID=261658 RepID=F4QC51_CACFS|nr:uncharacterized protein DFA_11299 [Cavenderia fasciculata]EGG13538.1 hypothetical protein DFA_11299 [Cavenderia fasciculata]|eukprot:XP_004350242.1 hypothetical protein DFA_11299 [Cavenderia fasciculata]